MRKTYKISVLIALMLSLALLFTACSSPFDGETDQDDGVAKTNEEYKALIGQWAQYVEFKAPEAISNLKAEEIAKTEDGQSVSHGNGNYSVTKDTEEYKVIEQTDTLVKKTTETTIYSGETGKAILSLKSVDVILGTGAVVDKETYGFEDYVKYTVTVIEDAIYEVKKDAYVLVEADPEATETEPQYEIESTYSYYKLTGEKLFENLEQKATVENADNYSITRNTVVTISDKAYVISKDGEFLAEFAAGLEYNIPVFNKDSMTPERYNGNLTIYTENKGYAYFEVGDYKYLVVEEIPVTIPVGEMTMFTIPGIEITVMNKNYGITANYKASCYAVASYAVLSNGDIYVCTYQLLSRDAATFDFELQGEKFDIVHSVISAKDGSVTNLERNFTVSKLYNETTKVINSFLNQASVGTLEGRGDFFENGKVRDGFILAEIQEYSNGVRGENSEFAVLNESLEVVAKLPNIIPNQFGYASYEPSGNMLLATRAPGDRVVYYSANVTTGEISLFSRDVSEMIAIENGVLVGTKVYADNGNLLTDLSSNYTNFEGVVAVQNGKIFFVSDYTLKVGRIEYVSYDYDQNGWYTFYADNFDTEFYGSDYRYTVNGNYVVREKALRDYSNYDGLTGSYPIIGWSTQEYYNLDGTTLFTTESYTKQVDTQHYYATYNVSTSLGDFVEVEEGVYICEIKHEYFLSTQNLKENVLLEEAIDIPEAYMTELVYYIIK